MHLSDLLFLPACPICPAGTHAPGRCSDRQLCPNGDSEREPLLCAYYSLLASATAIKSFRQALGWCIEAARCC